MTTLTIELPPALSQELQASGISHQQLQTLVTNFIQYYLYQHQAQGNVFDPNSLSVSLAELIKYMPELSALFADLELLPADIVSDLTQLDYLSDDDLWQAARVQLSQAETDQMQALTLKQQQERLCPEEQKTAQSLTHRYRRTMLIRAKAAALLKKRGYDISSLKQNVIAE